MRASHGDRPRTLRGCVSWFWLTPAGAFAGPKSQLAGQRGWRGRERPEAGGEQREDGGYFPEGKQIVWDGPRGGRMARERPWLGRRAAEARVIKIIKSDQMSYEKSHFVIWYATLMVGA